ncbi:ExeM/NucH family extracellular endonuclease [Methylobacter sp. S3L5C]|nr:ExeM/NucH family extracellular endonuclease [Methylobacter sp. S3L5C]
MIAKSLSRYPLLVAVGAIGFIGNAQAVTPVFINEIHYDNAGTDSGEAIEISGPAGTNLSGWSLVLYNGNGGAVYNTKALSGLITDQSGNGFGTLSFNYPTDGIQNGSPDAIALVNGTTVVQFLSYEGTFVAVGGAAAGMSGVNIGVNETSAPVGQSLQLKGNGTNYEDFVWNSASASSFAAVNTGQSFNGGNGGGTTPPPVSQCGQGATLISAIQGSGSASPLIGSIAHVEAVVSGDFQDSAKLNGFFVQQTDNEGDGNAATSEGLFITSNSPVNVGDRVHVVGTVTETFSMTRLETVSSVNVCSTGNTLPTAVSVTLPFENLSNNPEWREGMLINLPQVLTVTENYTLARYGELLLSTGGRLMTPTQIAAPGQTAIDVAAQNLLKQILVDDGSSTQNPDPVIYPEPTGLSAANTLRSGNTVMSATGILAYDYSVYRLLPTQPLTFVADNNRTTTPGLLTPGSLSISAFNVLNYFNGNGLGGGFPTARGATTTIEFTRQRNKIIPAIHALNADIIGLMEIENDGYGSNSAIADLVNGLNQLAGAGSYAFINPGVSKIGTDEISVGIIYKPAKASVVGSVAILDSSVNQLFVDTKNRPALAQTFLDKASNKMLTIAVNHLKSKGSACLDLNDPDTGDGQGNCNLTRTDAAEALAAWLSADPTHSGSDNALIVGDLNAYAKEDPITALRNAGYQNLVEKFIGNNSAYSYVFDGASGYLDHALANAALTSQVKGITEWHINADEPIALDYNTEFKSGAQISSFYAANAYRSSDHDPLLIKLFVPGDLDNDGDVDANDASLVRAQAGKCPGQFGFNQEANYDKIGCISAADYRIWYGYYNNYNSSLKAVK